MPGYKDPPQSTQFKPGQSGNPGGRPKKPDVEELNRYIESQGFLPKIAEAWYKAALGVPGAPEINIALFKMLIEHRNGLPPKSQDDEADAGGSIVPNNITIEIVAAPKRTDEDPST